MISYHTVSYATLSWVVNTRYTSHSTQEIVLRNAALYYFHTESKMIFLSGPPRWTSFGFGPRASLPAGACLTFHVGDGAFTAALGCRAAAGAVRYYQ